MDLMLKARDRVEKLILFLVDTWTLPCFNFQYFISQKPLIILKIYFLQWIDLDKEQMLTHKQGNQYIPRNRQKWPSFHIFVCFYVTKTQRCNQWHEWRLHSARIRSVGELLHGNIQLPVNTSVQLKAVTCKVYLFVCTIFCQSVQYVAVIIRETVICYTDNSSWH